MEHIHIAALRPDLDALESKQITAVVTLIWPYSSSQRQFALLLAEPDFRLRRKKGQVRARFSSTSARALAATGVGIGDEVVLSLHGAQFVQDGAVSTPGKSLNWELAYAQTVAISVRRNGAEIASLELLDAAPTPALRSPVRHQPAAPSPISQWSSPAFLKRARLSTGPVFEQSAYDPLADESNDRHEKKRRRKSYRDWKAWTYTARTPSPEKEDASMYDELDLSISSPSRPPQLPKTPVSPTRNEPVPAEPIDGSEIIEETTIPDIAEGDTTVEDGELQSVVVPQTTSSERPEKDLTRDTDYYDLYAGPSEDTPLDSQYDFGGDTELNTDDEGDDGLDVRHAGADPAKRSTAAERDTVPDVEDDGGSTTELATELEDDHEQTDDEPEAVALQFTSEAEELGNDDSVRVLEDDSLEVNEPAHTTAISIQAEDTTIDETMPETTDFSRDFVDSLAITMPPPSLPVLQTDFAVPLATALLTPVAREPSSPTLKAVDSATLPLPSPFPGEPAISYMDHGSVRQEYAPLDGPAGDIDEQDPGADADYIMENSFFSSISSSKAGGLHQDHETAFTPVRFTFGMDGAGWSRPLELSSPPPEDVHTDAIDDHLVQSVPDSEVIEAKGPSERPRHPLEDLHLTLADTHEEEAADALKALIGTAAPIHDDVQPVLRVQTRRPTDAGSDPDSSNVIVLSSDVELDDSEDDDDLVTEQDEEQSPNEETHLGSIVGDGTVSERDEVHDQKTLPTSSQVQGEPDSMVSSGMEVENEQFQRDNAPTSTQASAAVSAVVDLGSPSADEKSLNEDDSENSRAATAESMQAKEGAGKEGQQQDTKKTDDSQSNALTADAQEKPLAPTSSDNFDDFITMDVTRGPTVVVSSSPVHHVREPASIGIPDTFEEPPSLAFDTWDPQLGISEPLAFIEEYDLPTAHTNPEHSDIKMESIEDDSLYLISQPERQDEPQDLTLHPAIEATTGIPEDGRRLRALQPKSVPATAPARNTRSKTKSAASPPEEDAYVSRLSTSLQSTRSKASVDSTNRATVSPPRMRTRTRSTVTPTRDPTQTSPYSLRSQSKHLSPDKSMATSQVAHVRTSPRKLARRDTDFDIVPSQLESRDLFGSIFEPSQELGFGYSQASQGRYSDVGLVKDSEEDTLHSEGSMSTVQYSDDWNKNDAQAYTNISDVLESVGTESDSPRLKPPPASLSQTERRTRSRSRSMENQISISPSQPPQSPRRSLRSAPSTFSASPSPRITRGTKGETQRLPSKRETIEEPLAEVKETVTEESVIYPVLPSEGKLQISPPAPASVNETFHRSAPVIEQPSAEHPALQQSNLITPDDTQQSAMEPPLSFQARQPDQSLLVTPELTQTTSASASLRSFDIALPGVQTQPAPISPTTRTSPRRKPAVNEMAPLSPVRESSDAISADDGDATVVSKPDLPSIGLSTPLAYYTPLRDLIYFLNRSSQFHSSANPDVLALCTTASRTPERAKNRPRHWSTTLHITDLSTYPATTTVNVFRPYQNALPVAEAGDIVLLRAFKVESRKREPVLKSADESSWCVWRYGKPVWGAKKGKWAELRAREEVKGPVVERGEGEWTEVAKLRKWFVDKVRAEMEGSKE